MSLAAYIDPIKRRKSKVIYVGSVPVGGDFPITVQSMTNTQTSDANATIKQLMDLKEAGVEIARVSCPDEESTQAFPQIMSAAQKASLPIVADIHFHYKRALEAADAGADCLRLNPGNIGSKERVAEVVKAAKYNGCSMRVGVNAGSIERRILEKYKGFSVEGLVESALNSAKLLEDLDFFDFKISVKVSDARVMAEAYRKIASLCDYPLHLGVTEAGGMISGSVKSSIGIGMLLSEGIGDTLRVSLSADPVEEVKVGFEILKALSIRSRGVNIVACPSCARQGFDVIETVAFLEKRLSHIKVPMTVSIIGCVVNGIGEAMNADVGLTGGGRDTGKHLIYYMGKPKKQSGKENFVEDIVAAVEQRAKELDAQESKVQN